MIKDESVALEFDTLTGVLDLRAREMPERIAFRFLRDGEHETESVTFGELRRQALVVAARLVGLGAAGERAVLVYPQGLSFLSAFLGCLYAGVVAVPVSVPNRKRGIDIVRRVAADADARWLLSSSALLGAVDAGAGGLDVPNLTCLDTEQLAGDELVPGELPGSNPGDVALLQYTSGTTGPARGVIITHRNLVANHRQVAASLGSDRTTKYLSWLPMFHDMGLGIALQAIWVGVETILLPPRSIVQEPRRWLAAISRYAATTSGGPDFAYDLCVRRVAPADCAGLDLSSWRVAYNGSEPVKAATLAAFARAFAATGFRREAFHPVYGLAECTLLVSSEPPGEPPLARYFEQDALARGDAVPATSDQGRALVSCGRPWPGTELSIVDPQTREECAPGHVGEIWIRGDSVARGYFGRDTETRATFAASTARGRGSYLRTGDLGFVVDGRLFVTGRRRDVIVVGERAHYPHDIEATVVASHPSLAPHGAAAFTPGPGEGLVLVQEVSRSALRSLDAEQVMGAIRSSIAREHAIDVRAIDLLMPGTLPRTTSGKVRRGSCRAAFRDHSFAIVASFRVASSPSPAREPPDVAAERHLSELRANRLVEWLRRNAAVLIADHERGDPSPRMGPLLRDLSKVGLLGMQVDPSHGGLGLGQLDAIRVIEQLGAVHFKAAVAIAVNESLGIMPIVRHATSTLKSWLLPGLVHAEEIAAFAQLDAANPGRGPASVMRIPGDARGPCRLSGEKSFDAVVDAPTVANVFTLEQDGKSVSAFVIAGRDVRPVGGAGHAGGELGFARGVLGLDGLLVGSEHSLGEPGSGGEIAREASMHLQLGMAAACVGGMKRCAQLIGRATPDRAGKRTPNPVTLSRLGSIKARVTALNCLVESVARAIDAEQSLSAVAFAACKLLGPELLLRSIEDVLQLGFALDPADRERIFGLHRDAGLLQNHDGAQEAVAEACGVLVMAEDPALTTLICDVFRSPHLVGQVARVVETIRFRMTKLNPALAQRAQRWAHTRAGELIGWVLVLAALEGSELMTENPALRHAHAWAEAEFELALAAVRFGTPSDAAAIDSAEAAATFAAYAHAIGDGAG